MWSAPQGLHAFLRAYYHTKSADWPGNTPYPLKANTPRGVGEAAALLRDGQGQGDGGAGGRRHADGAQIADLRWLPDASWRSTAPSTGAPGSRAACSPIASAGVPRLAAELQLFAGRTIDVPAMFVSGKATGGVFQRAGSYEAMRRRRARSSSAPTSSRAPATRNVGRVVRALSCRRWLRKGQ